MRHWRHRLPTGRPYDHPDFIDFRVDVATLGEIEKTLLLEEVVACAEIAY
ncbi:MAG: hypothetical protein ABSB22_23240 [Thermodesulfobacteriota bacterium]